jgi:hypothetical protein
VIALDSESRPSPEMVRGLEIGVWKGSPEVVVDALESTVSSVVFH